MLKMVSVGIGSDVNDIFNTGNESDLIHFKADITLHAEAVTMVTRGEKGLLWCAKLQHKILPLKSENLLDLLFSYVTRMFLSAA